VRQLGGRYEEAAGLLRRALRHAVRIDTQFELATVIGALAISLWRGPTPAEEAVAGCRTLLADHAVGRRPVRATVNCPYAVVLAYQGEFDEARELVGKSMTILEQIGHAVGTAAVLVFAATVEGLAGQWETAERQLREAAAASARAGDMLSSTAAAAGLARALLEQGRVEAALEAAEAVAATGDPFLDAEAQGVRARALVARGAADPALREAERAIATADGTDSTVCRATARLDHAFVLHRLGREAAAAIAASTAEALFRSKGHLVGARRAAELSSPQQNRDGI
jgi:tetratricopeptide (TPR) repeat protein